MHQAWGGFGRPALCQGLGSRGPKALPGHRASVQAEMGHLYPGALRLLRLLMVPGDTLGFPSPSPPQLYCPCAVFQGVPRYPSARWGSAAPRPLLGRRKPPGRGCGAWTGASAGEGIANSYSSLRPLASPADFQQGFSFFKPLLSQRMGHPAASDAYSQKCVKQTPCQKFCAPGVKG